MTWAWVSLAALPQPEALSSVPAASNAQILAGVALTDLAMLVLGVRAFRFGEQRACRLEALNQKSGY